MCLIVRSILVQQVGWLDKMELLVDKLLVDCKQVSAHNFVALALKVSQVEAHSG